MYQDKITINPFPFIETIEDLQDVIYSFGRVYKSEEALLNHAQEPEKYPENTAFVKIKRILWCHWGNGEIYEQVVSDDVFQKWLNGESEEELRYTLNYDEIAEYITSDYFLSGYYNERPFPDDVLMENAKPHFELFEEKLTNARFAEQEFRAFGEVIDGYFIKKDIVLNIANIPNFPTEGVQYLVLKQFLDFSIKVIDSRLLWLRDKYSNINHPIAKEKLEQLSLSNSNAINERVVRVKHILSHYLLLDYLKKFNVSEDLFIRMLAQDTYIIRKYFPINTKLFEKTQFYVLCHVLGIIEHLEFSSNYKKTIPQILHQLFHAELTAPVNKHLVKDNFLRYYNEKNHPNKAYNPLVSDSANITKILLEKFPKNSGQFVANRFYKN